MKWLLLIAQFPTLAVALHADPGPPPGSYHPLLHTHASFEESSAAPTFTSQWRYFTFRRGYSPLEKLDVGPKLGLQRARLDSDLRGKCYQIGAHSPWVGNHSAYVTSGAVRWRTRSNGRDNETRDTDRYFGAGISRRVSANARLDFGYTHFMYDDDVNLNLYSITLFARF